MELIIFLIAVVIVVAFMSAPVWAPALETYLEDKRRRERPTPHELMADSICRLLVADASGWMITSEYGRKFLAHATTGLGIFIERGQHGVKLAVAGKIDVDALELSPSVKKQLWEAYLAWHGCDAERIMMIANGALIDASRQLEAPRNDGMVLRADELQERESVPWR